MTPASPNVTELLRNWGHRDGDAQEKLFQIIYHPLHRQAARYLRREHPGLSFQTTDLIHEAYLRLIDQRHVEWQNRLHFFAIAAKVMWHFLVDHARSRNSAKRGGNGIQLSLEDATAILPGHDLHFVALDEAFAKLGESISSRPDRGVRLFSGLSVEDTSKVLDVSERTVEREWNVAKAWLRRQLDTDRQGGGGAARK